MPTKKTSTPKLSARTKRWRKLDALHHLHPFTQTELLNREGVRIITRAKGIYLWDSEGKKLLDGMAGLWCVQVGYGNKDLAQAGCEALRTLPYYNHFFKTANPWTVELAAKLAKLLPQGHTRVLFANSGSEANDTALKLIPLSLLPPFWQGLRFSKGWKGSVSNSNWKFLKELPLKW